MNTKDIGNRTESIILSKLLESGYTVLIPFGDNSRYDFVVDTGSKFFKIQCKTGHIKNGCIVFATCSIYKGRKNISVKHQYTKEEIDYIMVYSSHLNKIYLIDVDELPQSNMKLRINNPVKNNKHIKWAKDYEFKGRLPER